MYYNIHNNPSSNINKTDVCKPNKANTEEPVKMDNELIIKLADQISSFENLNQANTACDSIAKNNPSFEKISNNIYKCEDYYVNIGKKFLMTAHAMGLKNVAKLDLNCAPELIAYSDLKNNEDCILITRVKGTETSELIPYEQASSTISLEAKQKLLADVEKLAEKNLANTAFYDYSNWYYLPNEDKIVISNWSQLAFVPENAKPAYRKQISEMCGLIY